MGKEHDLLEAARTGNLQAVKTILSGKLPRSGSGSGGLTGGLRSLLDWKHVNVNCKDASGETPLHLSALNRHREVVQVLLAARAAVTEVDCQGCTPLHLAAWNGHADICDILLQHAADKSIVNAQTNEGETPLHFAAQHGHLEVVSLLLQHKADPTYRTLAERSALDLAAQYGKTGVVRTLVTGRPELLTHGAGQPSPLHLAAFNGHLPIVAFLLDSGFPVNTRTDNGTALHEAATSCKLDVIKLLLDRGVDVWAKAKNNMTAEDILRSTHSKLTQEALQIIDGHVNSQRTPDSDGEKDINGIPGPSRTLTGEGTPPSGGRPIPKPRSMFGNSVEIGQYMDSASQGSASEPQSPPPPIPPRISLKTTDSVQLDTAPVVDTGQLTTATETGAGRSRDASPLSTSREQPKKPPRKTPSMRKTDSAQNAAHSSSDRCRPRSASSREMELSRSEPSDKPGRLVAADDHDDDDDDDNVRSVGRERAQSVGGGGGGGGGGSLDHGGREWGQGQEEEERRGEEEGVDLAAGRLEGVAVSVKRESIYANTAVIAAEEEEAKADKPLSLHLEESVAVAAATMTTTTMTTDNRAAAAALMEEQARDDAAAPATTAAAAAAVVVGVVADVDALQGPHHQTQPPTTPDYPPPSPNTAVQGIQQKIYPQVKRKSKDMETITESAMARVTMTSSTMTTTTTTTTTTMPVASQSLSLLSSSEEDGSQGSGRGGGGGGAEAATAARERGAGETTTMMTTSLSGPTRGGGPPCASGQGQREWRLSQGSEPSVEEKPRTSSSATPKSSTRSSSSSSSSSSVMTTSDLEMPANTMEVEGEVVEMRRSVSDWDSNVFAGLLRGSTPGGSRNVVSQICENVAGAGKSARSKHRSTPSTLSPFHPLMEREEDRDRDVFEAHRELGGLGEMAGSPGSGATSSSATSVVNAAAAVTAASTVGQGGRPVVSRKSDDVFDDSEEWAKIAATLDSFGVGMARESVFVREYEASFTKSLAGGHSKIQSVGEWLESLGLGQYENTLVANGFDDTDFLGGSIMEEQDLLAIGITNTDHCKAIVHAARRLPPVLPIDQRILPESVEKWLEALRLGQYLETFVSHKYNTMLRVIKLWELELNTVLDISSLGHRKRILASLGDRLHLERDTSMSPARVRRRGSEEDEPRSPFEHIDLYRDYTGVKAQVTTDNGGQRSPRQHAPFAVTSDKAEENGPASPQVSRDNQIHIRPPHLMHTTGSIRQWRHRPEVLIKGCCNYTAHYLGSTVVKELKGATSTQEGIAKLKKSTEVISKIPTIMLSISYKGVKFIDAKSKRVICDHEIANIFCACQDGDHMNFFAYVTKDKETSRHYCHVFSVRSREQAGEIILTLGEAFEIAYQMALKERTEDDQPLQLDPPPGHTDPDDVSAHAPRSSVTTV